MAKQLTADDILPLVARLPPQERVRLVRLMAVQPSTKPEKVYEALPPGKDEFSTDDDPLSWDAAGWDDV